MVYNYRYGSERAPHLKRSQKSGHRATIRFILGRIRLRRLPAIKKHVRPHRSNPIQHNRSPGLSGGLIGTIAGRRYWLQCCNDCDYDDRRTGQPDVPVCRGPVSRAAPCYGFGTRHIIPRPPRCIGSGSSIFRTRLFRDHRHGSSRPFRLRQAGVGPPPFIGFTAHLRLASLPGNLVRI